MVETSEDAGAVCAVCAVCAAVPDDGQHVGQRGGASSARTCTARSDRRTARCFSMRNVMMDNRGFGGRSGDGGSLLVGARGAQSGAAGYAVRFTVENVGAVTKSGGVGCVNDWITLLHSDENHNVALRLRCNQLELHAHNDYAQGDLAGPVIPFNFSADTPISLVVSVRGQTVTVATASGAPLVQWQAPAAYPLPASGRSVVLYVAGGSTACWEAVDGAPLS